MLERNAANLDAPSTVALRVLQPIFNQIPENLQICNSCHLGVLPGVQMCPRRNLVLTTIQSKVQKVVAGSLSAVVTGAAVACVDNQDESVEEVVRQPEDLDGNVPRRGRIGCARAQVLNMTYLARDDCADHIQVNEAPSLNPSRISEEGTFGFLNKGRGKKKALMNETEEEKVERLRKK